MLGVLVHFWASSKYLCLRGAHVPTIYEFHLCDLIDSFASPCSKLIVLVYEFIVVGVG